MNVSVRPGHEVRTCDDLDVTFDDRPAVMAVDHLTAPGAQKLTVHASHNGGVYVFGGSRTDFAISACKAAAPASGGPASTLEQVHASLSGGTLTATGPVSDGWIVYFIVDAPTRADLDLDATNGPIQVTQIAGSTTARAQNGPIRLQDVSGRVSARTENGPIAYDGGSGTVELTAQNGPVAVRLAGSKWADGSLTATRAERAGQAAGAARVRLRRARPLVTALAVEMPGLRRRATDLGRFLPLGRVRERPRRRHAVDRQWSGRGRHDEVARSRPGPLPAGANAVWPNGIERWHRPGARHNALVPLRCRSAVVAVALVATCTTAFAQPPAPTLAIINGKVFTGVAAAPWPKR